MGDNNMAKNIVELLEEAIEEVKNLERNNKTLTDEVGKLRYENINLNKQNEELKKEVERWKSVATTQK